MSTIDFNILKKDIYTNKDFEKKININSLLQQFKTSDDFKYTKYFSHTIFDAIFALLYETSILKELINIIFEYYDNFTEIKITNSSVNLSTIISDNIFNYTLDNVHALNWNTPFLKIANSQNEFKYSYCFDTKGNEVVFGLEFNIIEGLYNIYDLPNYSCLHPLFQEYKTSYRIISAEDLHLIQKLKIKQVLDLTKYFIFKEINQEFIVCIKNDPHVIYSFVTFMEISKKMYG